MSQYPRPAYHFTVQWGGTRIGVAEVSGLSADIAVIEHRDGADPEATARKMPGLHKFANITLKRGIVAGDNQFFEWFNTVRMNAAERRDVVINLLNENHQPIVSWKVRNAFPCKYSGPELRASANEVAIESIELAHEGLSVESA
jgi:phage tail-like protein